MLKNYEIKQLIKKHKFFRQVKLTGSAKAVLNVIIDYYNHIEKRAWPSQSTIANETGILRPHVCRAVKELKKIGLIETAGKIGFSSSYFFTEKFFNIIVPKVVEIQNVYQNGTPPVPNRYTPLYQNGTQYNNVQYNDKKGFQNFQNLQNSQKGINYPSANQVIEKIRNDKEKSCSPLDLQYEDAMKFLENLMPELQNSFFARELRKKWSIGG